MNELKTKEDIKETLNLSIGKIDKMMKMNEIPYYKIGKSVRFDLDDVLERIKNDYER